MQKYGKILDRENPYSDMFNTGKNFLQSHLIIIRECAQNNITQYISIIYL